MPCWPHRILPTRENTSRRREGTECTITCTLTMFVLGLGCRRGAVRSCQAACSALARYGGDGGSSLELGHRVGAAQICGGHKSGVATGALPAVAVCVRSAYTSALSVCNGGARLQLGHTHAGAAALRRLDRPSHAPPGLVPRGSGGVREPARRRTLSAVSMRAGRVCANQIRREGGLGAQKKRCTRSTAARRRHPPDSRASMRGAFARPRR